MASAAKQICANEMSVFMGTVAALKPRMIVRTDQNILQATRATSCLIEPQIGDLVMIAQGSEAQAFVLAILRRDAGAAVVVASEGDIVIESKSGAVKLRGREQIELSSPGSVAAAASDVSLQALRLNLTIGATEFTGRTILATVESLRVVASSIESFAESVIERFARLIRHISGSEQVLARNLQYRAEESCSIHGKNTLLTAEELIRIDSEQIHIG